MSEANLCARDLLILDFLFDPSQREKSAIDIEQQTSDEVDVIYDEEEKSDVILRSKNLELEGVELTEAGKLDEAIGKFDEAIEVSPQRPSPYNNRAQLYRLLEKDGCTITICFVEY